MDILLDTNESIESLIGKLRESYKPEMIMMFGSRARGDLKMESDLDLLIVKKAKKSPLRRRVDVRKILSTDIALDVIVYTPDEFEAMVKSGSAFIKTLFKEGKILYQSVFMLSSLLKRY